MRPKKYPDEEIKEDIRSFFLDPDHWVYKYGTPSECGPDSPYYKRQIEVLFEDKYFHWVTHRIVDELLKEGFLKEIRVPLKTGSEAIFVIRHGVRYYKRGINKSVKLIEWYSDPKVNEARGRWCEHLVEFMFYRLRFEIIDRNSNKFGNRVWTQTNHDLDFIVEKDGIAYGVEVKNTLPYMERDEFDIKLKICNHLGLVPLWILRNAPATQFSQMSASGGFILKFKSQIYPLGFEDKVAEIWKTMRLPVAVWERFDERFERLILRFHRDVLTE